MYPSIDGWFILIPTWPNPVSSLKSETLKSPRGRWSAVNHPFSELPCLSRSQFNHVKKISKRDLDPFKMYIFWLSCALPRYQPQGINQEIENSLYT